MSVLQMRTIMHEMEILASGGRGIARDTCVTWDLPINLRETFKRKFVWALLEGFAFSDKLMTIFNKRLPWMPCVIVLVLREEIWCIRRYGKRPQCRNRRMLAESQHCQTLSCTCLPKVCVSSKSFQTPLCLPGTSRQALNMWTAGSIISPPRRLTP